MIKKRITRFEKENGKIEITNMINPPNYCFFYSQPESMGQSTDSG
jgi:hypothetical protein